MNEFQRKITLRVFGGHILFVVVFFMLIPGLRGCFKPRPKEIVTFIEFGAPAPQVSLQEVESMPDPEPPVAEPEPAPLPEPTPVPEPPKVTPKPKPKPKPKEPVKKTTPKPKEPEKPKWKATDPKDINPNKSKRIKATPSTPSISSSEINKALSGIASSSSTGDPSRFNDYYAKVRNLFYGRWKPPATATSADETVVRIKIRTNGQIRTRSKIKGSGNALFDKTVMDAVNSVSMLPAPPPDYPFDYVEVIFTLEN